MEEGVKWVHSDTLGLVRFKSGELMIADATQGWPNVTKILTRWLRENIPHVATDPLKQLKQAMKTRKCKFRMKLAELLKGRILGSRIPDIF